MRRLGSLLAAGMALAFVAIPAAAAPAPGRCEFRLDRQGFLPKRAFDRVARGEACAVAWALRVLPHMDASNHEGLEDSLARSIRIHPERILRAIGTRPDLTAERLCTPFFSNEESARSQRPEQRAILNALARVRAPALQSRRRACEREVRAALPG
jgi:hypothetical protein